MNATCWRSFTNSLGCSAAGDSSHCTLGTYALSENVIRYILAVSPCYGLHTHAGCNLEGSLKLHPGHSGFAESPTGNTIYIVGPVVTREEREYIDFPMGGCIVRSNPSLTSSTSYTLKNTFSTLHYLFHRLTALLPHLLHVYQSFFQQALRLQGVSCT
jgi:hypothetical protein